MTPCHRAQLKVGVSKLRPWNKSPPAASLCKRHFVSTRPLLSARPSVAASMRGRGAAVTDGPAHKADIPGLSLLAGSWFEVRPPGPHLRNLQAGSPRLRTRGVSLARQMGSLPFCGKVSFFRAPSSLVLLLQNHHFPQVPFRWPESLNMSPHSVLLRKP